jgi:hypothetical protein
MSSNASQTDTTPTVPPATFTASWGKKEWRYVGGLVLLLVIAIASAIGVWVLNGLEVYGDSEVFRGFGFVALGLIAAFTTTALLVFAICLPDAWWRKQVDAQDQSLKKLVWTVDVPATHQASRGYPDGATVMQAVVFIGDERMTMPVEHCVLLPGDPGQAETRLTFHKACYEYSVDRRGGDRVWGRAATITGPLLTPVAPATIQPLG